MINSVNQSKKRKVKWEFLVKHLLFQSRTQLNCALSTLVYDGGEGAALELKGRSIASVVGRLRMQNYKFQNNIGPHVHMCG